MRNPSAGVSLTTILEIGLLFESMSWLRSFTFYLCNITIGICFKMHNGVWVSASASSPFVDLNTFETFTGPWTAHQTENGQHVSSPIKRFNVGYKKVQESKATSHLREISLVFHEASSLFRLTCNSHGNYVRQRSSITRWEKEMSAQDGSYVSIVSVTLRSYCNSFIHFS